MAYRIEIKSTIPDTRAEVMKKNWLDFPFGKKIKAITLVDVYTIDKKLTVQQCKKIVSVLTNSVIQTAKINQPTSLKHFNFAIEIGYLPGVTDNIANTAKESIEDALKIQFNSQENIYTSQMTVVSGNLSQKEIKILADSLYNPLIQKSRIKDHDQYIKDGGMDIQIPQVLLNLSNKIDKVDLNVSDEELIEICKRGIKNLDGTRRGPLALSLTYMKTIQSHFKKLKRNPTDIELESIAQTWSEHCKHTIFADPIDEIKQGLFKTYIQKATEIIRRKKSKDDFCVSVFTDNSGAIEFDKDYLITHKVETHNSPSALDPFGGAITGIVGVNRDAIGFGLGAKPIINTYGFCFAYPDDTTPLFKDSSLKQKMLEPKRILQGVIAGVNTGGNCSGIPTPQGFWVFDKRYKGKPLVFVGTVGLIPKKIHGKKTYEKKAQPGDYIVMIGGRVGLDGIHGATFSSEAMDSGSPATAVQIGDPITQKKLSDAVVKEARDLNLYTSITDNGAGGLSCSVAEMAKESGGCIVTLEKIPLKYTGLSPWQIWISESQERMTLAIPKNKWKNFYSLMKQRGVEASIIGKFTKQKSCVVTFNRKKIMDIDMQFLHNGLPERPMKTVYNKPLFKNPKFPHLTDYTQTVEELLKRPNIASFEFISMQYDHEVQGTSVLKPLQGKGRVNADATVTRPVLTSEKGVVISQGINPSYSDINTYDMAACAIDTAIRNAVTTGADPDRLALLDNFCWCSPDDPMRLGQLKESTKACFDYAIAYNTPFISGKDSMFNDFKGYDAKGKPIKISIPPTLLISSIGVIDDITKTVSLDLKLPGDLIYILGETHDELGASEYLDMISSVGGSTPKVYAEKNIKIYTTLSQCIDKNLIASAISVTCGGLGVALTKTAMGGLLGIDISLKNLPGKTSSIASSLFSESQGRIIVSVNPKKQKRFEIMVKNIAHGFLGKTTENDIFIIRDTKNKPIIKQNIFKLLDCYKSTFKNY